MLRFTRSLQQSAARQIQHTQQQSHTTPTHLHTPGFALAAATSSSSSSGASHIRYAAGSSSSICAAHSATSTRYIHSAARPILSSQSDDFFDPVKAKAEMKERQRLKREAEAAAEAANPTPKPAEEPAASGATETKAADTSKPASEATSDASASEGDSSAPKKKYGNKDSVAWKTQAALNLGWRGWIPEIKELKAYIDSRGAPAKKAKKRPHIEQSTMSLKEWSSDPAEKIAAKLKAEKEKQEKDAADAEAALNAKPYEGPTSLQVVQKDTLTELRIERIRNALRRMGLVPKKIVRGAIQQSEALKKVQDDLADKVEEAREKWETSQDPRVWRMRDMVDKVVGETDTGMALGEIMQSDPNWNYLEFLKEMEEIMIPEVIKAFRVGDMKLLKSCTEGDASRAMLASFRSREEQKVRWDDRILDIRGVDVVKASLHDDTPFIHLTFVCQHVAVEYDLKTGEMKDPSLQSVVQNTYYSWAIKKDYDSPYYEWKIFEFHHQNIQALI